jgi:FkbM family methyltransferase
MSVRTAIRQPRKLVKKFLRQLRGEDVSQVVMEDDPSIPADIFRRRPVSYHETRHGNYYLPSHAPNDLVANTIRAGKIFEPHVLEVAKSYAKPGTMILDLGANFGQMSILFSELVGEKGMVLSFEAQAYCFAILQKNIAANKRRNIRAFYGAVMDKGGGEVSFPEPDMVRFCTYGSYPLSLKPTEDLKSRVKTLAIDDLQINFPISFFKIDTQGSDVFVLRGARETIIRQRMPILFEYEERFQEEFGTCFQDYVDFAQSVGYRFAKTIADINYLLLPDPAKVISLPPATASTTSSENGGDFIAITEKPSHGKLCKILKTESEIKECTDFLNRNGYIGHGCIAKNWDLAHIVPEIGHGNLLDMGSSESCLLKNCSLKRTSGEKYGIDYRKPDDPLPGVTYLEGDLLKTPLPDQHLNYITCLSVIEHQVDLSAFARESSRLLAPGGKLFVTFDYWEPKIQTSIKLFGLDWAPLDRSQVENLVKVCSQNNLFLVQDVDWTTQDPVLRWGYFSPHPDIAYSFGLLVFEKTK